MGWHRDTAHASMGMCAKERRDSDELLECTLRVSTEDESMAAERRTSRLCLLMQELTMRWTCVLAIDNPSLWKMRREMSIVWGGVKWVG